MENKEYGYFEYVCKFWDEEENKMITRSGVVFSYCYADAMAELERYYGDIETIEFHGLEPCNVYEFNNK